LLPRYLWAGKSLTLLKRKLLPPAVDTQGKPVIWLHAVSLGEMKAGQPLYQHLQKMHSDAFFLITTSTQTGFEEAHRSYARASAILYLPFDFSWIIHPFVYNLKPKQFIAIEGDLWPNLLTALKSVGAHTMLVSGKLSRRSARRLKWIAWVARKWFSAFDVLCMQSEDHAQRIAAFVAEPSRIKVTGNLKYDANPVPIDLDHWKERFRIDLPIISLISTHAPEEAQLLPLLLSHRVVVFLIPRHPERFQEVKRLLERMHVTYALWSSGVYQGQSIILVDAMGQVPICAALSSLAIVGGSFVPGIGGHNVFEPCLYGAPTVFGPHTTAQTQLVSSLERAGAGRGVTLETLPLFLNRFLTHPEERSRYRNGACQVVREMRGALERTIAAIQ
jgi:3-deoxy-D-manno-octulosonic-acid transferase